MVANRLSAPAPLYDVAGVGVLGGRARTARHAGRVAGRRPTWSGVGGIRPGRRNGPRGDDADRDRHLRRRRGPAASGPDHAHRVRALPRLRPGSQGLELIPAGPTPGPGTGRQQQHRRTAVCAPAPGQRRRADLPGPGHGRPGQPAATRAARRGRLRARARQEPLRGRPGRTQVHRPAAGLHRLLRPVPHRRRPPGPTTSAVRVPPRTTPAGRPAHPLPRRGPRLHRREGRRSGRHGPRGRGERNAPTKRTTTGTRRGGQPQERQASAQRRGHARAPRTRRREAKPPGSATRRHTRATRRPRRHHAGARSTADPQTPRDRPEHSPRDDRHDDAAPAPRPPPRPAARRPAALAGPRARAAPAYPRLSSARLPPGCARGSPHALLHRIA